MSCEVYWCAGAGVVASTEEDLAAEVAVLEAFLERWQPDGPGSGDSSSPRRPAGCTPASSGAPFTEHTEPAPLSPYGHAKLRMEGLATEFAAAHRHGPARRPARRTSTARARTCPSRRGSSPPLCRAQLTRQPISVYVSLDTRRDYLFVDDAAAMVVAATGEVTDHGVRAFKVHRQRTLDDGRRRPRRPAPDHAATATDRPRHQPRSRASRCAT